jgi:DNA methylase
VTAQDALYRSLRAGLVDPALSWSEHDLPEHERTKHVHRLHPYLGKFVPQLVEVFLRRYFTPGQVVLDPFAGSGTTLVECSTFGAHAVGVDVSAFNALLCRVKTRLVDAAAVERDLRAALARFEAAGLDHTAEPVRSDARAASSTSANGGGTVPIRAGGYLDQWFAPGALRHLRRFVDGVGEFPAVADLLRVIVSRAARSCRQTTHYNLDFPRVPQHDPYWCRKHRRICVPTTDAARFLRRYTLDTARRVQAYQALRTGARIDVLHADARIADYGVIADGLVTSPPYPGRIDYHEQHRYAFELLGLAQHRDAEIGAAWRGRSRAVLRAYQDDMTAVFANARRHLRPGATIVIVIDDTEALYDAILDRCGFVLSERRIRHVNRRTGQRAGEFFEQVLIATA